MVSARRSCRGAGQVEQFVVVIRPEIASTGGSEQLSGAVQLSIHLVTGITTAGHRNMPVLTVVVVPVAAAVIENKINRGRPAGNCIEILPAGTVRIESHHRIGGDHILPAAVSDVDVDRTGVVRETACHRIIADSQFATSFRFQRIPADCVATIAGAAAIADPGVT